MKDSGLQIPPDKGIFCKHAMMTKQVRRETIDVHRVNVGHC